MYASPLISRSDINRDNGDNTRGRCVTHGSRDTRQRQLAGIRQTGESVSNPTVTDFRSHGRLVILREYLRKLCQPIDKRHFERSRFKVAVVNCRHGNSIGPDDCNCVNGPT